MMEFLPWIKDLSTALHGRPGSCNLMGSGIRVPEDLLGQLLHGQEAGLHARLAELNEWGHPALVQGLRQRYAVPADKELLVTSGATAGFWLACYALLAPGDRVLVEAPVYEPLRLIPGELDAAVDVLPRRAEPAYQIDPDELASLTTPRTKLVILTNLHNPSGAALGAEVLRQVATAARARSPDVLILVDETFFDFQSDALTSSALLGPAFLTISTLTKVYGLGLLRCGWVIAAADVLAKIRSAWVRVAGIGSRLTEALASLALDRMELFEANTRAVLARNRPLLREHLGPLVDRGLLRGEVAPSGCICFPEVVGTDDTERLVQDLARAEGTFVVPGKFFGAPAHIRIGFGGDAETLQEGLRRLALRLGNGQSRARK
jgi:aspartate/methionine/tyrosine aminotransferase